MLGDDARHPRYIETIPKRGYRFIVDVEEVLSDMGIVSNELPRPVKTHVAESPDAVIPTSEMIRKIPTTSIETYECYLRGRQLFYQMRRRSLESARQFYLRAIGMDVTPVILGHSF